MPVPTAPVQKSVTHQTVGTNIGCLLSRQNLWCFQIPKHQRAYSWENIPPNFPVKKFLEDIETAVKSKWTHNFGSLDLRSAGDTKKKINVGSGGKGSRAELIEVNDGQQRLITFFLTFAAISEIRKLLGDVSYEKSLRKDLRTKFEFSDMKGKTVGSRIELQEDDLTKLLIDIMQDPDKAAYKKKPKLVKLSDDDKKADNKRIYGRRPLNLMIDAYRQIREYLGGKIKGDLKKWENIFYKSEIVLTYSSTPPYVVFESRNARGIVVSELDKVKNKIIHYQEIFKTKKYPFGQDIVTSWWNSTKNMEDGEVYNENKLLGYALTIVNGRTIDKGDYNSFLKYYKLDELNKKKGGKNKRSELEDFILAIDWISEAMNEVYKPHPDHKPMVFGDLNKMDKRKMNKTQRGKIIVNLVNITNRMDREGIFKPLILLTYNYVEPTEFVKLLDLLEKITFRVFLVNRSRVDSGSADFADYCNDFYNNVKSDKITKKEIKKHFNTLCNKLCKWAIEEISNEDFYKKIAADSDAYKSGWGRYFLYHWEMSGPPTSSKNSDIRLAIDCTKWGQKKYNKTAFTMEHIMPKSGWEKYPIKEISALKYPPAHEKAGHKMRYYWKDKFLTSDNYVKKLNLLGNLVLSHQKYNTLYDDLPYIREASIDKGYLKSKRVMYRSKPGVNDWKKIGVLGNRYTDWNLDTIEHRQERMARWARHRWKLPCEEVHILEPLEYIPEFRDQKYIKEHEEKIKEEGHELFVKLEEEPIDDKIKDVKKVDIKEIIVDLPSDKFDINWDDGIDYEKEMEDSEGPQKEKEN